MQKSKQIKKATAKAPIRNCRVCDAKCYGQRCHKHTSYGKYKGRLSMLKRKLSTPTFFEEVFVCIICSAVVGTSRMPIKQVKAFKFVCEECGESSVSKNTK